MTGIGGKQGFHLLTPGVHIFGIDVDFGRTAGDGFTHVVIGNTGTAVQDQRNIDSLRNGFHLRKTQFGFAFIQSMGRTQRRRQAVNLSFFHQGVALLRIGVDDRRIDDAIFASGNRP